MIIPSIYVGILFVMSLVTFVAYGIDKRQAKNSGRRISEARLHWLALLGGWPGAWAGQQFFRHKTQKFTFRVIYWSVVVLHVALIAVYCVIALRP